MAVTGAVPLTCVAVIGGVYAAGSTVACDAVLVALVLSQVQFLLLVALLMLLWLVLLGLLVLFLLGVWLIFSISIVRDRNSPSSLKLDTPYQAEEMMMTAACGTGVIAVDVAGADGTTVILMPSHSDIEGEAMENGDWCRRRAASAPVAAVLKLLQLRRLTGAPPAAAHTRLGPPWSECVAPGTLRPGAGARNKRDRSSEKTLIQLRWACWNLPRTREDYPEGVGPLCCGAAQLEASPAGTSPLELFFEQERPMRLSEAWLSSMPAGGDNRHRDRAVGRAAHTTLSGGLTS
ncbi:hypothetical protein NDU88_002800 [Pleurodeles waltl]|uniref:Uncharacterized protein n=1 Tax=Pleurodeles waltl TaxID=8319 RepID=A0AAV7TM95_PLEWA|nr:hypothetical protein NDU88_002800 [Pleurodeles waltl]